MTTTFFWVMMAAAGLAAVIHIFIFIMESILWAKPAVMRIFRQKEADLKSTRLIALNQGFYNLFLAGGILAGFGLTFFGHHNTGLTVITSMCVIMFGASLVLLVSSPRMMQGVLIQGMPPLIFLAVLVFSKAFV